MEEFVYIGRHIVKKNGILTVSKFEDLEVINFKKSLAEQIDRFDNSWFPSPRRKKIRDLQIEMENTQPYGIRIQWENGFSQNYAFPTEELRDDVFEKFKESIGMLK